MSASMEKMYRDYCASWSSHDAEKLATFFTDDLVYEDVPMNVMQRGKEEFKASWTVFFDACPDFKIELKTVVVSGDRGASEWTMSGKPVKDLPGLPATGKGFSIRGASIFELQGGKIKRNADYWDLVSMLQQVGLMPMTP